MSLNKKQQAQFAQLKTQIEASADRFIFLNSADAAVFEQAGLLESNPTMTDADGNIAVRLKGDAGTVSDSHEVHPPGSQVAFQCPRSGICVGPAGRRFMELGQR